MKKTLSLLLVMVLLLCAITPAYAADTPIATHYRHDPRLNAKAMADIVVDPTAVYGFSPSKDGALAEYAKYDWTDAKSVAQLRQNRLDYLAADSELYALFNDMTAAGKSAEEIARAVCAKRNELRTAAVKDDPEALATLKKQNLDTYGHEEGPLADELFTKYGSWEAVTEKTFAHNSGMDACVGLYDDYYDYYVKFGYVTPEKTTAATREHTIAVFIEAAEVQPEANAKPASFTDADQISAWYRDKLLAASAADIVTGYEDGSVRPKNTISRVEAFVILSRCLPDLTPIRMPLTFSDVPAWAKTDIDRLSAAGLVEGYGNGKLGSEHSLTVEQVSILASRIVSANAPMALWTANSAAKETLLAYVDAVTDKSSKDFIPIEDRIAVFDLDGTLFCETDPNYFDYTLLVYRVLEDPDYKDKASAFEREVANKIVEQNKTGASFAGLEVDHGKAIASAFAGMTLTQFNDYIQKFKQQPMPSYTGMNRGDGFYLPMAEIVNYLQANDFTVYVVSGTDRLIVRGILSGSKLNIPNRQIIGSDELIVSNHQGSTDGLDYVFKDGDELVLGGEFLIKNLKMNKVSVIAQEIGQQPVLSFGNSTGDSSMAEYVTYNNRYRSLAFMLLCDDTQRENGNETKAEKMRALCTEYNWVPISMKNDWRTIYGSVTYQSVKDAA